MCCIHLAEPLPVENETVVTLGAVLNTGADLPPPADSTVDTVADCWAGTRTAAHVTRLTAVHRHTHTHTHAHPGRLVRYATTPQSQLHHSFLSSVK